LGAYPGGGSDEVREGDQDDRRALAGELAEDEADTFLALAVGSGGGFVEEQDGRFGDEGARAEEELLLTTGQLDDRRVELIA